MSVAVSKDVTYSPKLGYSAPWTSTGWGTPTATLYSVKRTTHFKPASVHTPVIAGWRAPRAWNMTWADWNTKVPNGFKETVSSLGLRTKYWGVLNINVPAPNGVPLPASAKAQLEIKALNALRNGKVDLGVSFGERKEAAGMMLDRFTKIAKAYRSFRKGHFRDAARHLGLGWRDAPNNWLEYQYGWKPMLGDVYTAVDNIANKDNANNSRCYYRVKKGLGLEIPVDVATSASNMTIFTRRVNTFHLSCRFDFMPNPDMDMFRTLDEWGVTNPSLVAWELVPFSFVVDWALPIGDFLNALTAARAFTFRGGSFSQFNDLTSRSWLKPYSSVGFPIVEGWGEASGRAKAFTRTVYSDFPFPDYRAMAHTKWQNPDSETIYTRTANALSLLASAVK